MHTRARPALATGIAAALLITACSDGGDAAPQTTIAATTTTIPDERVDDGVLTLGVLLPTSDAVVGEPMTSAALDAIAQINDAGGVFGRPVRRFVVDEGSTAATAAEGIQSLLDRDVDAIIGPSSSTIALSTLREAVKAEVLTCSPTASALALDDFPDDDLFFRTIPSDSLQAQALAETVEQSGARSAAVVYVDDAYGRPFAEAVEVALGERGLTFVEAIAFSGRDADLVDVAASVVETEARAIVVIADSVDGTNLLNALGQVDHTSLTSVVVSDAMRTPSSPQIIGDLPSAMRRKITGVSPRAEADPNTPAWEPPGFFAVNAFDCVNLIALAALQADSDSPIQIAGQMAAVSASGASCRSFEECKTRQEENLQFDYDGPSGGVELLTRQGDPRIGTYQLFSFDESGRDMYEGSLTVQY